MKKPHVMSQFTKSINNVSLVRFLVVQEIPNGKALFIYGDQECTVESNGELTPPWNHELDTRKMFPTVDEAVAEYKHHFAATRTEGWTMVQGLMSSAMVFVE
ncbi:hypothetical protein [Edaphobacter sp. 12200R-103]|uniref:hypothetical protein n=1 Tax=Edaphobacter sp. 12200R-103 TaxID=2703788 RepID=UPI00138C3600|nr:hypothetical protein [Edaphobacter sp. 12200R-103]QHS51724.1 hypothetical protein GWR55_08205 [Edaphobacter sp. 12200R-103]